ncbi:transcription factor iiib 90 kda subunit [Plakobranchus ocellatus]|uniref:Transcription factor iiib 90 kDa subunit n=1 Tax=Plakobranchus ocellatus TaxID=259542 RepID=A0AAV3YYZ6_9GAST|nr:transcription factor iiib 90 kda subunit [Plakobranchus ocellatus]
MCLFGRTIQDFIPIHPGKYQPHKTWQETLASREEALHNQHRPDAERLSAKTRVLPPLTIGDCVHIQNQTRSYTTKRDKTGTIIEVTISPPGRIITPTRPPQPHDQKFDKPLPVDESLQEPDLPLDDTNLIPTMDPARTGDSTPHGLASPKNNRATHPEPCALRALKPFNKPGLKETPLPSKTRRITCSQKGSTKTRES